MKGISDSVYRVKRLAAFVAVLLLKAALFFDLAPERVIVKLLL